MRNGAARKAKAAHGSGEWEPRRRATSHHTTTGAAISNGYATSREPKALPSNCGRPGTNVATASCPTVRTKSATATSRARSGVVVGRSPRRDMGSLAGDDDLDPLELLELGVAG